MVCGTWYQTDPIYASSKSPISQEQIIIIIINVDQLSNIFKFHTVLMLMLRSATVFYPNYVNVVAWRQKTGGEGQNEKISKYNHCIVLIVSEAVVETDAGDIENDDE